MPQAAVDAAGSILQSPFRLPRVSGIIKQTATNRRLK